MRAGERTITTLGAKLLPRGPLPLRATTRCSSSPATSRRCSRPGQRGSSPRPRASCRRSQAAGVTLDLLTASANDPGERSTTSLDVTTVVLTDRPGAAARRTASAIDAAPLPGPVVDTYGAGDSFAAALCFALARGDA